MVCKNCKIMPVRMEGFNRMYAPVFDIVTGNRLVEIQSCQRALVTLGPVARMGSISLFEDCD
jgi:hypothetical protein